ncbi:membrane protein [Siccirubricoccus deserti]|uniref:DMT family transporter n=1 Tax=Siccirubricoccus deserti TaxID=2013562 RepID=A0A9X0UBY2_9PROT|nr:DMT family transporter [Siccirubricoccus deserti]MBC4014544.1 DMT family transporter [Siccirubricoccus deserti]GGC32039.1 membrane protein [Siccirubricoccus deserti]
MKGPALLLAAIAVFGVLDANGKLLSGAYPVGQVISMRYIVLLPVFFALRGLWPGLGGRFRTAHPGLHALRIASMMVSAASFFLGFRHVSLAEGYLVFFTAPFMTLALAALVAREPVPRAAWFWCAVGFGGVLVAVVPKLGGGGSLLGFAWVLLGTIGFSVTQTVNRQLKGESGLAMLVVWPGLAGLLIFGPLAVRDWVAPPPLDLAMLMANGLLGGAAVVLSAAAYRHADAARLGTYGYAALPVSVALDFIIWGRVPDAATQLGGAVVIIACVMSERARRRTLSAAQGTSVGNRCVPSGINGKGVTARTAASGSGP